MPAIANRQITSHSPITQIRALKYAADWWGLCVRTPMNIVSILRSPSAVQRAKRVYAVRAHKFVLRNTRPYVVVMAVHMAMLVRPQEMVPMWLMRANAGAKETCAYLHASYRVMYLGNARQFLCKFVDRSKRLAYAELLT